MFYVGLIRDPRRTYSDICVVAPQEARVQRPAAIGGAAPDAASLSADKYKYLRQVKVNPYMYIYLSIQVKV